MDKAFKNNLSKAFNSRNGFSSNAATNSRNVAPKTEKAQPIANSISNSSATTKKVTTEGLASKSESILDANAKVSNMEKIPVITCVICKEAFSANEGIICPDEHFVCSTDLNSYLTKNVFESVYKLRRNRCAVMCPMVGCKCSYNALILYSELTAQEKHRYASVINDLMGNESSLRMLRSTLIDLMTLKCPTCKTPVDPLPDACSAIMCLNCGNHYCNYCFEAFACGDTKIDRSAAHEHAAKHNDVTDPESRDSFLSAEIVARGQKEFRKLQIEKCLAVAMYSTEYADNGRHDVALALLMCAKEVEDLGMNLLDLWKMAEGYWTKNKSIDGNGSFETHSEAVDENGSSYGLSNQPQAHSSESDDGIDHRARSAFAAQQAPTQPHNSAFMSGGLQLANAIITSNAHAIMQIVDSFQDRLDVDFIDKRHGHPLTTLAILASQPWAAKLLIQRGADPLKQNASGRSVLYIAVEAGLLDVVECILDNNPNINMNEPTTSEIQNYFPIHVAARYNHGHLINLLVSRGSLLDPEEKEHGYTPLMLALVLSHEWAAAELVKAGAQVRYIASNGRTPMFVAAEKGLSSILNLMITRSRIDVNEAVVKPSGLRLLHVAAFHKKPHVVAQLIEAGANVNQLDDEGGYTPLAMAIIGNNPAAALDIIAAGAAINCPSKSGRKPLYVAVEKGLTEVVRKLLESPLISVNDRVTSESSAARPLHVAVLHGQSHLIPLLTAFGADVNIADEDRLCTPLLMATILQDIWSVRLLLRAKADISRVSREGRTALYIAAEKGNSNILRLLVNNPYYPELGADINMPTTTERHRGSALHVAVMFDNAYTVMDLLEMGADINMVDAQGKRPIDLAKELESQGALEVLTRYLTMDQWSSPAAPRYDAPNATFANGESLLPSDNSEVDHGFDPPPPMVATGLGHLQRDRRTTGSEPSRANSGRGALPTATVEPHNPFRPGLNVVAGTSLASQRNHFNIQVMHGHPYRLGGAAPGRPPSARPAHGAQFVVQFGPRPPGPVHIINHGQPLGSVAVATGPMSQQPQQQHVHPQQHISAGRPPLSGQPMPPRGSRGGTSSSDSGLDLNKP